VTLEIPDKLKQNKSNGSRMAIALCREIQASKARSTVLLKTLAWRKPLSSLSLHVLKGYPDWCLRLLWKK